MSSDHELHMVELYRRDLPDSSYAHQEFLKWKVFWENSSEKQTASSLLEMVSSELLPGESFPNIKTIFKVSLLALVSSATVERANSALKFVKTARRSSMTEHRLNALVLLFVHKDIEIPEDEIVDIFAKRCPRRIKLQNMTSKD